MRILFVFFTSLLLLVGCENSSNGSNDNEIYVKDDDGKIIATTSDFSNAEIVAVANPDDFGISAQFRDENKIKEMTETYLGQTIHIYLEDELLSSPKIMQVITGQEFVFNGDFSEETAQSFIDSINK
ncbi:MAG: SecDF P1 head subdomain-containing protein [Bacillota bacterium]